MEIVIRIVNGTVLILAQDKIFAVTIGKTMGVCREAEWAVNLLRYSINNFPSNNLNNFLKVSPFNRIYCDS